MPLPVRIVLDTSIKTKPDYMHRYLHRPAFTKQASMCFAALLLLACLSGHVQMVTGLNRDSLRNMLRQVPSDTGKVGRLIQLGQQFENNDPDSAVYYYDQARKLSEQLSYPAGIIRYINNYTAVLNVQGKFEQSLRLNLEAVSISRREHLPDLYLKALINTGAVYQYTENYELAARYYLEALPHLEANNDPAGLSVTYGNLCGLYRNLRQGDKAMHYASLSKKNAINSGQADVLGSACINLGNALKDLGRVSESVIQFNSARNIAKEINDKNMEETALIALGDAYLNMHQYPLSVSSFNIALGLATELEDVSGQAYAMQGTALGLFNEKKITATSALLRTGISFAESHDQKEVLSRMLLLMSDVEIAMGRPEEAQRYRARQDSITSVLLNGSLLQNIEELETKYGSEKKQREILEKDLLLAQNLKDARVQRNLLLGAALSIALLSILLAALYRIYRQRQQLSQAKLDAVRSTQESDRLKSVLEGEEKERLRISREMHDDMGAGLTRMLFLSRALSSQNDVADKLKRTSEGLIVKMNDIIWSMNNQQTSLKDLVAELRAGAGELPESAGIAFNVTVESPVPERQVPKAFRRNIYLVVREAIHNAVKHSGASSISLDIGFPGNLVILVRDNGRGFDAGSVKEMGNGLINMKQRVELLGGTIGFDSLNGTTVSIYAPLPL